MATRPFDADAQAATETSRPVPRGIAFHFASTTSRRATLQTASDGVGDILPGWEIRPFEGLRGWFEAVPPDRGHDGASEPMPLGEFWDRLRAVRELPRVDGQAEPLLLVSTPLPGNTIGFAQDQFGLWGWPYDDTIQERIEAARDNPRWHMEQLRVAEAWMAWKDRHPGGTPGDGVVVAHPDTGFTDHPEMTARWLSRGRSFLGDGEDTDALDDLAPGFQHAPGHGTATASLISSGDAETDGTRQEIHGVAPGARILPLRVSRSVIHFDFGSVARAILHAVEADADVISMSLGGPAKSEFLRTCIRKAHEQGIIVVSAAGNNLPTVVYPAAFPEVIAVAATHAGSEPWRYSGLGGTVDIAAPGEEVWRAKSALEDAGPIFSSAPGTGTSYATACVAGLVALWVSYHGGRAAIAERYGGDLRMVPLACQYTLAKTANTSFDFVRRGRHGNGIADAEKLLLHELPSREELDRFRSVVEKQSATAVSTLTGLLTGWLGVTDDLSIYRPTIDLAVEATVDEHGSVRSDDLADTDAIARARHESDREHEFLARFVGEEVDALRDELLARVTVDRYLLAGCQRWRPGLSLLPLFDRLLGDGDDERMLSVRLREALVRQAQVERERQQPLYQGQLDPPEIAARFADSPVDAQAAATTRPVNEPEPPAFRMLRAYAFDPSQETMLDTAPISQVTVPVRWERLGPGPVGEYLEVIDVDPASGCVYAPVDLNHPHVLVQDGLAPSEGSPQFHQQMVYAVAMNTINRFELALGRPVFWSAIRPWLREQPEERRYFTRDTAGTSDVRDRFVQHLRIHPHGLREANAHYSPAKRALLFGYFPASDDPTGKHFPGGMVFTCLSHDIIVHETTHALMDGMHPYFNEPGSGDMWAFHEAFADIIALFQHFTYPDVLRHQIARTRGDLETNNLLAQLAQQFGQAAGGRHALRDALGDFRDGVWERRKPDPRALQSATEPHARGSILVAAVFDAFLALYNDRIADLVRLSTGGTGEIPAGQIHPDLVNRLATTAAQTAEDVLNTCIRALDYLPPVDVVFGEFLRALITADYNLSAASRRWIRVAFIEAFRAWGIYPRDVPSLSEESLMWRGAEESGPFRNLREASPAAFARQLSDLGTLRPQLEAWQPGRDRKEIFEHILKGQLSLHELLVDIQGSVPTRPILPGVDLRKDASFSVSNLRLARRTGALGEFRNEMVVEIVQSDRTGDEETTGALPPRGGATLIVDLSNWDIRYIIHKRLYARMPDRPGDGTGELSMRLNLNASGRTGATTELARPLWQGEDDASPLARLARTYGAATSASVDAPRRMRREPFRMLHHGATNGQEGGPA